MCYDVLTLSGHGPQDWAKRVMGLRKLNEQLSPFDNQGEFKVALRTLNILLRRDGLDVFPVINLNIFCLDSITNCIKFIKVADNALIPKITVIATLDSVQSITECHTEVVNSLIKTRLVLYFNSFMDLYERKGELRKLSKVLPLVLISELRGVVDDIELLVTLCKALRNAKLGLLAEDPEDMLKLDVELRASLAYLNPWLLNEVVRLGDSRGPSVNAANSKTYILLPSDKLTVLGILRTGFKILSSYGGHFISNEGLTNFFTTERTYELRRLFRNFNVLVSVKLSNGTLISEQDYRMLQLIQRYRCLKRAAEELGISYVAVRRRIQELEKELGVKLIASQRGGDVKGATELLPGGVELMRILSSILSDVKRNYTYHPPEGSSESFV